MRTGEGERRVLTRTLSPRASSRTMGNNNDRDYYDHTYYRLGIPQGVRGRPERGKVMNFLLRARWPLCPTPG